jgi:HSP20 family molecular chaperone IbpA
MFDDGEDHWFRMNFGMNDVSSSADWVKKSAVQMASKLNSGPRSLSGLADQFFAKRGDGSQVPTLVPSEQQATLKGETESYNWYQTGDEVDITVRALGCVNKKDIKVVLRPRHVTASVAGTVVFDAELDDAIIIDESTWTFSDNLIQITLSKKNTDKMWKSLLASE